MANGISLSEDHFFIVRGLADNLKVTDPEVGAFLLEIAISFCRISSEPVEKQKELLEIFQKDENFKKVSALITQWHNAGAEDKPNEAKDNPPQPES